MQTKTDLECAVAALALRGDSLDAETAVRLIAASRQPGALPLVALLLEEVNETELLGAIAAEIGMPFVDLYAPESQYKVDDATVRKADIDQLKAHNALPLLSGSGQVVVAMANPRADQEMVDYLRGRYGDTMVIALSSANQIQAKLVHVDAVDISELAPTVAPAAAAGGAAPTSVNASPVVEWVDQLMARGAADNASDVHFRFTASGALDVRFRVDGRLRRQPVPAGLSGREGEIVGAILAKCSTIDPSDQRRPQDGTFSFLAAGNRQLDARLAMLPQAWGPTVVVRILDPRSVNRKVDDMGFSETTVAMMRQATNQSQGLILLVGPTGSGKLLPLSTPVPTPTGMTTMGDLAVGDVVLGRDGHPCNVIDMSAVELAPELYRVRFSDGQEIIADADHQWLVSTHRGRSVPVAHRHQASLERHTQAHTDAEKIEGLAHTWTGPEEVSESELFDLLAQHQLTTELGTAASVRAALAATSCLRTVGADGAQYPAVTALTSLADRLRERFDTDPATTAALSRMTTAEMLTAGVRLADARVNFAAPVAAALELPKAELPVDPYALGHWLGSGLSLTASCADGAARCLTCGRPNAHTPKAVDGESCGTAAEGCQPCRGDGLANAQTGARLHLGLSKLGVHDRKHIPMSYLRSSKEQRMDLLRGLMDTNGAADANGVCELALADRDLAVDALALVRSLGIKVSATWGHDACGAHSTRRPVLGIPRHRLRFTTAQHVFSLPGKAQRVRSDVGESQSWLYITDIVPVAADDVDYEPARCISVDSEDRTYLCGDGFVVTSNTTTLYGLMNELDRDELNILTVEDPIEYRMPGIGQTQIRGDLGEKSLTFGKALRAILRLDPDVILVGEIRDKETAEVAMNAALTGHLVLSTLHTNSALGVVSRLSDLDAEPFAISEALSLAVSQRLIRRVHDCKVIEPPTGAEVEFLNRTGLTVPEQVAHAAPRGCSGCNGTGYRGRIPVVEVLAPSPEVRTLIARQAPQPEVLEAARRSESYGSMLEDGYRHVLSGQTTVASLLQLNTGGS